MYQKACFPVVSWQPREQKEEEAQLHMFNSYSQIHQSGESSELVDEGIDRFQESVEKKIFPHGNHRKSWSPPPRTSVFHLQNVTF